MARKKKTQADRIEGNTTDRLGLGSQLKNYLESLKLKNYADGTILKQRFALNAFIVWAGERSLTRVSEITHPVLERYQRHLYHQLDRHEKRLSFRNQHGRLSALRSWFKWLSRKRYVLYNPASELELPKLGHRLPRHVLSLRESEEVINGTTVADPIGVRDRAIFETFYSTGMRRLELIGLDVYDIDTDRGVVSIRQGNGKKDRVVPIGARALAWTERYRHEVRPNLVVDPNETALFLSQTGKPFTVTAMSVLVRAYVDKAAIGKTGSCHLFRHTMATLMLENGADLRFIQAMLPFNYQEFADDKQFVLDVRAQDSTGRMLNIEMQVSVVTGLAQRLVYYACSLYVDQIESGDKYIALEPAISICLLNEAFSRIRKFPTTDSGSMTRSRTEIWAIWWSYTQSNCRSTI